MDCKLCGLPNPTPPIEGDGHAFCCIGCREVFKYFGEDILREPGAETPAREAPAPDGAEAFLRIDGMHCSSCEILIERLAERIDGIHSVASSYATSTAKVIYDAARIDESQLPDLLSVAGYRAWLRNEAAAAPDNDLPLLRVVAATSLAAVVMMLYLAFYYPTHIGLVDLADLEPVRWLVFKAVPIATFTLTTVLVFYVGLPIFRGASIGLRAGVPNMDNLLSIAILAAYGYSTARFFAGSLDLYFDVAATIVAVITIGRYFERGARMNAAGELARLLEAWTPRARIKRNGAFEHCGIDELRPGEHLFVWQGEAIPIDGTIVDGAAAVDGSLVTGEPYPVARGVGDSVLGGTTVVEGTIEIETGPAVKSQMDSLAHILWNVQSSTSGMRRLADRIARIFVPLVLVLSVLATGWSLLNGEPVREAVLIGLATLIVSCPCTFGLAIPLAIAAGVGGALRRGIIITSAETFEKKPRFDIVVIDKTGTLSSGEMSVVEILGSPRVAEIAAAVERHSVHPIAEAIARLDQSYDAAEIDIHPGQGATASVEGCRAAVGGRSLFAMLGWDIPEELIAEAASASQDNGVVSYVGWDGETHGAIVTLDRSRPGWRDIVSRLKRNSRTILLTGAEHPGGYEEQFDEVFAGVPPEAKGAIVRRLRNEGSVVMIGDGSNDAPALAAADLGIAFGAPTSLAADAADVVIPGDRLDGIFEAFSVIGATRRRIRQNLGWALLYNATAIPLALSGHLNPLFAALAMSASSLLVVWNSSRPIAVADITDAGTDRDLPSARTRLRLTRK